VLTGIARAQIAMQAVASKLDEYASREEYRLGLQTRIRAAERLCIADPSMARLLLDHAIASLEKLDGPNELIARFTGCYARLDLYGVEQATAKVADRASVYVSLIRAAVEQKDYALATRWVREARKAGLYSLAGTTEYLPMLPQPSANEALKEMVRAFPEHAGVAEVRGLLYALTSRRDFDEPVIRDAIHRIFQTIDRLRFDQRKEENAMISTFNFGGQEIKTKGTYETTLLICAAYLAVYDFEAFKSRRTSMPEWWPLVALATRNELPGLMRVPQFANASTPTMVREERRLEMPAMPFDADLATARKLTGPARYNAMTLIERRTDLSASQREAVLKEMTTSLSQLAPAPRLDDARFVFSEVTSNHLDDLFEDAAITYVAALDEASRAYDDPYLEPIGRHDGYGMSFDELMKTLDERHFTLPTPHPTIEARRLQAELDRAAASSVDFKLKSTDGIEFQLSKLKGKVLLLDFWAGFDQSTRAAAPVLDRLSRDLESKGLVVLGVSTGNAQGIDNIRSNTGMSYPTLIDPDRRVHLLFGIDRNSIAGTPKSYVFDRDGNCVGTIAHPATEESARAVLKRAGL